MDDTSSASLEMSTSLPQHETLLNSDGYDGYGYDAYWHSAATGMAMFGPTDDAAAMLNDHDALFSGEVGRSLRFLQQQSAADGAATEAAAESNDVSGPWNTVVEIASNLLLFLLIFGMSATVDMKNLVKQLHNKFAILTGVAMQFLIMPLLGYLSILALGSFGLTSNMGLTLLIVTASPGGSYSNWWCSMFNADLALSVTMTAISTILSIAFLPANLMLYTYAAYGLSREEEESVLHSVDFKTLFISLAVVILAIFTGLYASFKVHSPRFQRICNHLGSLSGIALIVFSAAISTSSGGDNDTKLWGQHWSFYVGVAAPCIVGLVLANFFARLARLKKPEIVTVSVECCYQNVGIATSAAVAMFDDESARAEALCVPLFYGFVEAVVLGLYCAAAWKCGWTKAPRDEKLCVVLAKTYEVSDEDDADGDEDGDQAAAEAIEVEYYEQVSDNGAHARGERVIPPAALETDLERASAAAHSSSGRRSRLPSSDRFSENGGLADTFSTGLLDGIVAFFTARRRRRQQQRNAQGQDAEDAAAVAKADSKDDLPASGRARTMTEATVRSESSHEPPLQSNHSPLDHSPLASNRDRVSTADSITLSSDSSSYHNNNSSSSPAATSLGASYVHTPGAGAADLSLPTLEESPLNGNASDGSS